MTRFLADTSAWNRSRLVADAWEGLLIRNELYLCTPVRLELLYATRGKSEYGQLSVEYDGLPSLELDRLAARLAERTQTALALRSQHRGPRPIDLLIAAVAEAHGAVLLHYDRHFDAIGRVTAQPMEWLAPRGSLD